MTFVSCGAMVKGIYTYMFMLLVTTGIVGQTFTNVEPIQEVGNEYKVTAFTLDNDNNKYVGTNKGLVKVSANGAVENLYSGGAVQAIVWHRQEGIWIAIDGNKVYQPSTGTQVKLEGEDIHINAMALSGSQVWVGTNNGVYVISTKKNKVIEHYTTANSKIESNNINDIYIDASRLKWIGTDRGIVRVDNKKWKVYEKDYKFTAMTGNSEGTWIAAGTEMWLVDSYNRWARTGVSDGLSYGAIRALAADQKGKIYILSDILVQFDPYTDIHVEIENKYTMQGGDNVALLVDMNDKVWVGTLEHGLTAMDLDVAEDQPLVAYIHVVHPKCSGDVNGSLSVTAQGGRSPYDYAWSDNALTGPSLAALKPGDYSVTVTDADDFTFDIDVVLADPRPMSLTLMIDESDRSVEAMATGGSGGYSYSWSNGASTKIVADLDAGTHELVVTDNSGCTVSASHTQDAVAAAIPGSQTRVTATTTAASSAVTTTSTPAVTPAAAAGLTSAATLVAVNAEVLKTLDAATLAVGQTLRIDQLSFDADSTNINDRSKDVLDEVYEFLKTNDRIVVEIGGHTNGLPEHDYCDKLSSSRAHSVAEYLYGKGIAKGRIASKGYGKREPIATNSTVVGRRKNQRVELKVLEI